MAVGLDDVAIGAAVTSFVSIVTKTGLDKSKDLLSLLGTDVKDILNPVRNYVENYSKRHGILKVLGMPEAVSLSDIYTSVKLLSERDIGIFESITALEEAYRTSDRRGLNLQSCEKRPGLEVANEQQFLMVLGNRNSQPTPLRLRSRILTPKCKL